MKASIVLVSGTVFSLAGKTTSAGRTAAYAKRWQYRDTRQRCLPAYVSRASITNAVRAGALSSDFSIGIFMIRS